MDLSRRERQIMDAVYSRKSASVSEVRGAIEDPPGYSAVRATMRILEEKGCLKHVEQDGRFVYSPTIPRERAARKAIRRFLVSYFDGSVEQAVASLLSIRKSALSSAEYDRLLALIQKTREEGR